MVQPDLLPDPVQMAQKMEVIKTVARYGKGQTKEDPVRLITQYWTLDGKLLATVDPIDTND